MTILRSDLADTAEFAELRDAGIPLCLDRNGEMFEAFGAHATPFGYGVSREGTITRGGIVNDRKGILALMAAGVDKLVQLPRTDGARA